MTESKNCMAIPKAYRCKAKRISDGEWMEGYYVPLFVAENKYIHRLYTGFINESYPGEKRESWKPVYEEIDPETLCRFTGLMDNKGNPIFESDRLAFLHRRKETCGIVQYHNGIYYVKNEVDLRDNTLFEVLMYKQAVFINGNHHDKK